MSQNLALCGGGGKIPKYGSLECFINIFSAIKEQFSFTFQIFKNQTSFDKNTKI